MRASEKVALIVVVFVFIMALSTKTKLEIFGSVLSITKVPEGSVACAGLIR